MLVGFPPALREQERKSPPYMHLLIRLLHRFAPSATISRVSAKDPPFPGTGVASPPALLFG